MKVMRIRQRAEVTAAKHVYSWPLTQTSPVSAMRMCHVTLFYHSVQLTFPVGHSLSHQLQTCYFQLLRGRKALRTLDQLRLGSNVHNRLCVYFLQPVLIRTTCYYCKQNDFLKDEIDRPAI